MMSHLVLRKGMSKRSHPILALGRLLPCDAWLFPPLSPLFLSHYVVGQVGDDDGRCHGVGGGGGDHGCYKDKGGRGP